MERRPQGEESADDSDEESPPPAEDFVLRVAAFEDDLERLEAFAGRNGAGEIGTTLTLLDDAQRYEPGLHSDAELRDLCQCFGRFVTVLGRTGRRVRSLRFSHVDLSEIEWFLEEDVVRLFSDVLPALLPSLRRLSFSYGTLPAEYLCPFLTRLSAAQEMSLSELAFEDGVVEPLDCVPAVAELIRRNVPIQVLKLNASGRMNKDCCQHIFSSLEHNSNLRHLELRLDEVYDDGPILPSGPCSTLRSLRLDVERWTARGRWYLARQLRTNTTLEELHIFTTPTITTYLNARWVRSTRPGMSYCYGPWIHLLETYNFTLHRLTEMYTFGMEGTPSNMADVRITACLQRNTRIRQGLQQLVGYQVLQFGLLPHVLDLVSGRPTLVYRFLRQGDLSTLGNLLLLLARQSAARDGKKKKRSRDCS